MTLSGSKTWLVESSELLPEASIGFDGVDTPCFACLTAGIFGQAA